ncbi:hypothetical protein Clacol_006663 [Clathrus columnatus]|uniref:Fe2OG dioxygenase domain-containing protein n=1 Tax=Clathrus columnatus TaxID=1419009 RepID=A0AAV5ACP6_9AGAM|nr:hypothetical protein Clacol_006663 [Clathrus columnatus]
MNSEDYLTNEKALKKAMRKYLKNKQPHCSEWTPFRAAEKQFKAKFPPPNLQTVLDLWKPSAKDTQRVTGNFNAIPTKTINVSMDRNAMAYIVPERPEQKELIRWSLCTQAREVNGTNLDIHYQVPEEGVWDYYARSYNSSHNDSFMVQPKRPGESDPLVYSPEGPRPLIENIPVNMENFQQIFTEPKSLPSPSMHLPPIHVSKLLTKLRWANIGYYYHWGSKSYDFTRPKSEYPEFLKSLCKDIVASIDWKGVWENANVPQEDWGDEGPDWKSWPETYEPDAGIVNFYQPGDTLCGHVDRSEVCATSPLVSISLGNSAIFLMGGLTRSVDPIPILLRSGDLIIMSGPSCRRAFHGVPKIFENTLPDPLRNDENDKSWKPFADYLRTTRININVRQVFPRGFNPLETAHAVSEVDR